MENNKQQWSSGLGFILASAGSAAGLGNIWKFPGRAYEGGGGLFILVYVVIVALLGAPLMIMETALGRNTGRNAVGAYKSVSRRWSIAGWFGVITGFIVSCYYIQLGGWVIEYFFSYVFNSGAVYADPKAYFGAVLGSGGFPVMSAVIYPAVFLGICVYVLIKGVSQGIEKFSMFAMPALVMLLFILLIRSVTLEGSKAGIKYMLSADFEKFSLQSLLSALGQAFYSLSIGLGIMITYGAYLGKNENIVKNTVYICLFDTLIAVVAAFIIIPAVFSAGTEAGAGGSFVFVSLAEVFKNMPSGSVFGALFYLLLFFAAVTSEISIFEAAVVFATNEFNFDRVKTIAVLSVIMLAVGVLYTISQVYVPLKGIWFDAVDGLAFPSFGDCLELLTDRFTIPVGAFLSCIFAGYVWKSKSALGEIESGGKYPFRFGGYWLFTIRYLAPACIFVIFVCGIFFGISVS